MRDPDSDTDPDRAHGYARKRARCGEVLLRQVLAREKPRRVLVEGARGVFPPEPEQVLQVLVGAQLRDVLPGDAVRRGGAVLGMRVGMVGMEPVRGISGETEQTARPRPRPRARPRRPEPRPRRDVPSGDARREPREPVSPERHLPRLARQRVRVPARARVQVRARLARLLGAFLLGHQGRDRRSRARRSRAQLPRAFSFRFFFFYPPRRRRFRRRRGGAARFATRLPARAGRARGFGLATLRTLRTLRHTF